MPGLLAGKTALISGAARGQGRSHAVRLAEEGAEIIAFDICAQIDSVPYPLATPEDLEETVALVEQLGRRIVAKTADVRDASSVKSVVEAGLSEFGSIDIVCANAGIAQETPNLHAWEISDELWADVIGVNVTGVWHTISAAVPSMIDRGAGGSISVIASSSSAKGMPLLGAYVTSKHGVIGLTRAFAHELAPYSIRVNAILPTGVRTPMIVNPQMEAFLDENPEFQGNSMQNLLPVELVEPVDVSNAVLWLASDAARYLTGVSLPVDAGFLAR